MDYGRLGRAGKGGGFDADGDTLDRALNREKTLHEHLTDQALIAGLSARDGRGANPHRRCG